MSQGLSDYEKLKEVTAVIIDEVHPELGSFFYPVHAIVKSVQSQGTLCSIQILDKGGGEVEELSPIPFVKVPNSITLTAGDKVRVIFDYADSSHPSILGVL